MSRSPSIGMSPDRAALYRPVRAPGSSREPTPQKAPPQFTKVSAKYTHVSIEAAEREKPVIVGNCTVLTSSVCERVLYLFCFEWVLYLVCVWMHPVPCVWPSPVPCVWPRPVPCMSDRAPSGVHQALYPVCLTMPRQAFTEPCTLYVWPCPAQRSLRPVPCMFDHAPSSIHRALYPVCLTAPVRRSPSPVPCMINRVLYTVCLTAPRPAFTEPCTLYDWPRPVRCSPSPVPCMFDRALYPVCLTAPRPAFTEPFDLRPQALQDRRARQGERVALECSVPLFPAPERVVWARDDAPIRDSPDYAVTCRNGVCSLVIVEVFPEDSGRFTCTVTINGATNVTAMYLTVEREYLRIGAQI